MECLSGRFDSFESKLKGTYFYILLELVKCKIVEGGPRGRVGKVAEFKRSLSFDYLTTVTGVGSSPALATCETSQVLLAGVSGGFPGVLPFRPTYRLARLDISEIFLKGTLN